MNTTTSVSDFTLLTEWPIWVWILLVSASIYTPIWMYKNTSVDVSWKRLFVFLRMGTLLWVVFMLANPATRTTTTTNTPDQIIFLIDQTTSMLVEDVLSGEATTSRQDQFITIYEKHKEVFNPSQPERVVHWYGYHGHPFEINPKEPEIPSGGRTDLLSTINQLLTDLKSQQIAAIVIFGDGRETQTPPPGLLSSVQSHNIPLVTIPLGSKSELNDISITSASTLNTPYAGDQIPVFVDIAVQGDIITQGEITVSLVDVESNTKLDTRVITEDSLVDGKIVGVVLRGEAQNNESSTIRWRVEASSQTQEPVTKNNTRLININTTDAPLRTLYVEGRPRWEYRYLKNLLVREKSIESSTYLLTADPEFVQEGDRPINRLPSTEEEFLGWDVIIIGDIPPTTWTTNQANTIKRLVAQGDMSVVWLGGEGWGLNTWSKSPLVDLLPIHLPSHVSNEINPFYCIPTQTGLDRAILGLNLNDHNDKMYWKNVLPSDKLKPGVEVLASTKPPQIGGVEGNPILTSMRYGSGTSIYSTTDEYWRWRNQGGDEVYKQFWIQLLRSTQTQSTRNTQSPIQINTNPQPSVVGSITNLNITLDEESDPRAEVTTTLNPNIVPVELVQTNNPLSYTGIWVPTHPGNYTVRVVAPGVGTQIDNEAKKDILVVDFSDEARQPATDHAYLEELSIATNGAHVPPEEAGSINNFIPDRSTTSTSTINNPLWSLPWIYFPPIMLLGCEWLLRRKYNLV